MICILASLNFAFGVGLSHSEIPRNNRCCHLDYPKRVQKDMVCLCWTGVNVAVCVADLLFLLLYCSSVAVCFKTPGTSGVQATGILKTIKFGVAVGFLVVPSCSFFAVMRKN